MPIAARIPTPPRRNFRDAPRAFLGAVVAAAFINPGIVWAQSADATLRGKAPANSDLTGFPRTDRASFGVKF